MAKPDFTGTWKFDSARSSLQISPPRSTVFRIDHNEPRFHLERTHVFDATNSDTFSIELTTDGKAVVLTHRGLRIRATLRWEGDALLFDSTIQGDGDEATNVVRYTLSGDRRLFTAEEKFRSRELNYDNRWVFEKQ